MPLGVAQALDQLVCHVACAGGGRAVRRPITLSLHVSLVLACFGAYVAVTVKMCVIVDLVVSRLVVVTAIQIIAAIRCRCRGVVVVIGVVIVVRGIVGVSVLIVDVLHYGYSNGFLWKSLSAMLRRCYSAVVAALRSVLTPSSPSPSPRK